jgi:outer membrane protein insertion porin family
MKPLLLAALALVVSLLLIPTPPIHAQRLELANRPIAQVRIEGLKQVPEQLVMNQVRALAGTAYDRSIVDQDIVRITHLGRFSSVIARVEPQDNGSVILTFVVQEQALLSDVEVVGNKEISDKELLNLIKLRAGDPMDPYLIERGRSLIKDAYAKKNMHETEVTVDQDLLTESNLLIYRVREGPAARIRKIQYHGNAAYSDDQLATQVHSSEYIFIFSKGALDRETLDADAARVRDWYRDRGYLDAQVSRQIQLSADQRDAVVTFMINEGREYSVSRIIIGGNRIFSTEQILEAMTIRVGDAYSLDKVKKSEAAVVNLYGKLGFIEVRIGRTGGDTGIERLYHEQEARVDLVLDIHEGGAYQVGRVLVTGNTKTQDKVIYRQVRGLEPGRTFDRAGIDQTQKNLRESRLFNDATVTVLGDVDQPTRDVLIDANDKDKKTGSVGFGAGISSDNGIIGTISLSQENFDITDTPDTFGQFITGNAFRGAGQKFNLNLQPGIATSLGTATSNYSVSFVEPNLAESDYSLSTSAYYFERDWDHYSETHIGGTVGVGKRFGDVWSGSVRARAEDVDISNIDALAPPDYFAVAGDSAVTTLGLSVNRNTTDSNIFPTHGSNFTVNVAQTGALGGDFDFTTIGYEYRKYWTLDEDFLGHKTTLTFRNNVSYIPQQNAPFFERFYAGGERSFRGFALHGVGPVYNRTDGDTDPEGGYWMFLAGLEYNAPIYEDIIRYVIFTDTGTVTNDFGFDAYRVSIGVGIRIKIPFLGQAPFALDLALPLLKQPGDQTRIFGFDIDVPF